MPSITWVPVDGEIIAALEDLTARLRRLGALVEMVQPEGFDLRQHHEAYSMLLSVIAFAHLDDDERAHVVEVLQESSDLFANAQIAGVNATVPQFIGMHGRRGRYRDLFREFFRNFDVLLAPVTITPAFPHISDQVPVFKRTLQVNVTVVLYIHHPISAAVAAYRWSPPTAFPWGQTRRGLPIGLQAIGPYLEDRMTIAFASMLEREFGGFTPPPGYY